MPLTLVPETGEGLANANTYASVAQSDDYHLSHLYPEVWTAATDEQKKAALAMATRVLDAGMDWKGQRRTDEQALAWPRVRAERPDSGGVAMFSNRLVNYWPDDELPPDLVRATCELARELLVGNRTADDASKGIRGLSLGQGAISIDFDKLDRKIPMTDEVQRMLRQLGRPVGKASTVRTVRV